MVLKSTLQRSLNVPKIPDDMLETEAITQELTKLLNKGVIVE